MSIFDNGRFGIAGLSTHKNIDTGAFCVNRNGALGVAGVDQRLTIDVPQSVFSGGDLQRYDDSLKEIIRHSPRLGDRAVREAWRRGVWFSDYTYITTPYHETDNGGHVLGGGMRWRNGREKTFARENRALPLLLDSCGYRREITGTAPRWAMEFDTYLEAIQLTDPDGYAAWDYPDDRQLTLDYLRRMEEAFPDDIDNGRLWPVFSLRWTWNDKAHLNFSRLPQWSGRDLAYMIPINRTQREYKEATRDKWARQALANALAMAADPDFRRICDRYGRVMIGGMVGGGCPRMARHILAAALCELLPGVQFWLLGQANFAVVNGLGMLGLLDRVWTDGTWWIKDAAAERFAFVEEGLITMHSFEAPKGPNGRRVKRQQTFFTLTEMMAANLRSLLSAYEGLWNWPPPEPLPLDLLDIDQANELRRRYQAAQLELGI